MSEEEFQEVRSLIVKSMLEDFPELKERVKNYLSEERCWEKLLKSQV